MPPDRRRPEVAAAASGRYDLIVVGGGVHGIMVALEAARRDLRPLLIERAGFGAATTANSLRIVHGGLRYLQSFDLPRHRESVAERRWFLRHFPEFVEPLMCLMPLYGEALGRPLVLRAALAVNDLLSLDRNAGVRPDRRLPAGRVVDADEVRRLFPAVDRDGLRGGAVWYDAFASDAPRLIREALRWACAEGAAALDRVEAVDLLRHRSDRGRGAVAGVRARDAASGEELELRAPVVVNAAGPWCARLAAAWDRDRPDLFRPSLAWNVLFRREPPAAGCAVAVSPRRRRKGDGAQVYFLVPWQGALLAGTGHAPWHGEPDAPRPGPELMERFIADLNAAIPGLGLSEADVQRVFAGLLPAAASGSSELARRVRVVDHGAEGGPAGLFSVSGIKLTTARAVAERALRRAFPGRRPRPERTFQRAGGGSASGVPGEEPAT